MSAIGIDIGGTTTRVGLVDAAGRVARVQRFDTPRAFDALLDKLSARIQSLREASGLDGSVTGIGVAVAGLVDRLGGVVLRSVNLPFLEHVPLVENLSVRTGVRVCLVSDADAATWGEYRACAPPPLRFVHLRLGTGVGCGIVFHDTLLPTGQPRTTHWHVLVVDRGRSAPRCACGLRGCLETIASGPAIQERAAALELPDDLGALQLAVARGETGARDLVSQTARAMTIAISNLKSEISELDLVLGSPPPKDFTFCLGGGVIRVLPCLFEEVSAQWAVHPDATGVSLRLARLGDDAGLIGASRLAEHHLPSAPLNP